MEDFSVRLKKLRVKNQLSQENLAAKLGVTAQAVSKWERGISNPDISIIVPMANLFRISTDQLLGNENMRGDWEMRWQRAMLSGDPAGARLVAQSAQQELPENRRHFLFRQAQAETQLARNTADLKEKQHLLLSAEQQLRDLVNEFPEYEEAALSLVGVLLLLGQQKEAETIAMRYPNGLFALIQKLHGKATEEMKLRAITGRALQFFGILIDVESLPALDLAERLVEDFPWDARDKASWLSLLCVCRARCLCATGDLDGAMATLEGMRELMHPVKPTGEAEPLAFPRALEPPAEDWIYGLRALKDERLKPLEDREEFQALLRLAEKHSQSGSMEVMVPSDHIEQIL